MAWADVASSGTTKFTALDEVLPSIEFKQTALSQAALVPVMAGTRDAFTIGERVSVSQFSTDAPLVDDFSAISVGVPLGWARQASAEVIQAVISGLITLGQKSCRFRRPSRRTLQELHKSER